MKPLFLALMMILPGGLLPAAGGDGNLAARLQARIDAFHAGAEPNGEVLRVVYFHPGDVEPQADYVARVRRILGDVQAYYHAGMVGEGFTSAPALPLERDADGQLRIHLVQGSGASGDYTYQNGFRVKREIQAALEGAIDFSSDFVLVLGGMAQKRGVNDYRFHGPYYGDGGSSQVWGLCYAVDCEVLDPRNLTAAKAREQMVFEEHYGDYKMTVARFNSWYLGGIAHELGHGLSLPHNGQLPAQKESRGDALMGGGNHTYGDDRWGGGKGSFMTLASCLRLAVHPLFTGSDRGRFGAVTGSLEDLHFEAEGTGMTIRGRAVGSPDPLAVIAYCDPPGRDGYNALTWVGEVEPDGRFTVEAKAHVSGLHELRLTLVHLNGATRTRRWSYRVDAGGHPDADALQARETVQPAVSAYLGGDREEAATLAREILANQPGPAATRRMEHLIGLVNPPEPVDLKGVRGERVFLSDAEWTSAGVGWGGPARNQYYSGRGIRDALFLEVGGEFFEKGLYAHAPSRYVFDLGGSWKRLETVVGLQGGVGPAGRSRFIVKGDGKVLVTSRHLKGAESQKLDVNVAGVRELELIVESGVEGNAQCWSVWAAPELSR